MRKTVTAAAMAASLTIGGAAGAALFVPSISGAQEATQEAESTDEARPEKGQWLAEALAPLVEAGTIDQGQADAVIEAIQDARPDRPGHRHGFPVAKAMLETLGLTGEELRAALQDGQTIADIAAEQGVSTDDLIAAGVAEVEEKLATAVENGRLTQEEADEKLAEATERITALVNGELDPGDLEGRRGRRGPGGPRSGDGAPDDAADDTVGA